MTIVVNGGGHPPAWTKPFLYECLRRELSPTEFLASLSTAIEEHGADDNVLDTLAGWQLAEITGNASNLGQIVDLATFTGKPNESVFDYLDCLLAIEVLAKMPSTRLTYLQSISWECYLHHIIAFDKFDRFESVDLLVRKIEKVARTIKYDQSLAELQRRF